MKRWFRRRRPVAFNVYWLRGYSVRTLTGVASPDGREVEVRLPDGSKLSLRVFDRELIEVFIRPNTGR